MIHCTIIPFVSYNRFFLIRRYAGILFINHYRIETKKKKLQFLTFEDFEYCADIMMHEWPYQPDFLHDGLDTKFINHIREVRSLLQIRSVFEQYVMEINTLLSQEAVYLRQNDSLHSTILRHIIYLAVNITQTREFRDVFIHIMEWFVEPFHQFQYKVDEVDQFFKCSIMAFKTMKLEKEYDVKLDSDFEAFMDGLRKCVLRFYTSKSSMFAKQSS
jgi:hypothetical protein